MDDLEKRIVDIYMHLGEQQARLNDIEHYLARPSLIEKLANWFKYRWFVFKLGGEHGQNH
ncbi:hypothetical protein UFOVP273_112 [uncultured Caudovirales phage]|uniref:Uncharacterized protein n=1 Tax=uncultured Caudovirales phage TaxID=2100421 RepID=A0A6J5LMB8_9CAUD|nr:hypothetical protein UFOVP273_112 [uncultured Caudovirales phage]